MRIIDHFDSAVALYPNNVAFLEAARPGIEMTYATAGPKTIQVADAIAGNNFSAGSHVGILAPNCTEAFLALLGLFRAQCVWLPINPRNPASVNADLLERFDGELLLFHSSFAAQAAELMESCPNIREAVCIDDDQGVGVSLQEWSSGTEGSFSATESSLDELFAIFPTGGTTGRSKGVMLTHRNIHTLFCNFYAHFKYHDDSCHLVVAPMTHTAGITGCMHFARGGCNVMMNTTQPEDILSAMEQHAVTHLFLPPTLLYMLIADPSAKERDFSKLQHFLVGAAPTSLEKLKESLDIFGPVMTEAFGQTEAPASVTAKAPWDYLRSDGTIDEARLHSIGRPCVFNQVEILDDHGQSCPRGTPGEICIRGELVSPGYYKNPEATEEVRGFGWHHTGDIGVMSEDGYITIVDRKKDMIISGGFNVFPNEVEQVLTTHSAVQDCAVIGVPDEKWGESVKAVIQLKPGASCEQEELISLVKTQLGSIKAPKSVDIIDNLPRSPVGKVLKAELRKAYWDGKERAVN